jgi:hypothetical protein
MLVVKKVSKKTNKTRLTYFLNNVSLKIKKTDVLMMRLSEKSLLQIKYEVMNYKTIEKVELATNERVVK